MLTSYGIIVPGKLEANAIIPRLPTAVYSFKNIDSPEKNYQESRPLNCIGDNFKKIIVVKDDITPWHNDAGILIIGIKDFLLNKNNFNL